MNIYVSSLSSARGGLRNLFSDSVLAVLSKILHYSAGLLAAVFAGFFLTLAQQGLFFTFLSFATLAVFIELGLNTVIIQFISHERAVLASSEDKFSKESARSRMVSIGRFAFCWFWIGAALFAAVFAPFGVVFFRGEGGPDSSVVGPWLVLAGLLALDVAFFPAWSLLEGAGKVRAVYAYRSVRALFMAIGTLGGLAAGFGLWSLSMGFAAALPISAVFVLRFRNFFAMFRDSVSGMRVQWRKEIFPLQWRLAVSWMAGYVANWAITPVTLKLLGPEAAGQVGMTWAAATGIAAIASAVVFVKAPLFGTLVATRRFTELDRVALRQGCISLALAVLGCLAAVACVLILSTVNHPFSSRFIPLGPFIMVLIGVVLIQITLPMAVYLRAHKREPFFSLSVSHAVSVIVAATVLGYLYGVEGIAAGYLAAAAFLVLPGGTFIFVRCRNQWHASH